MVLKLYLDLMSQPSRALYIFFSRSKIPFELCPVAIRKGAHKQPDFLEINRFGRVPAIDDNGFKLSESVAILRYVTSQYPFYDDHWYPKDIKERARVDEFLEWQHIDLRYPCASYFWTKIIIPRLTGKPPSESSLERSLATMNRALDNFEENWLGDGRRYINGSKISIADVFAACEIEQSRVGGYDPTKNRPNLALWLPRLQAELEPHYREAHVHFNKLVEKSKL